MAELLDVLDLVRGLPAVAGGLPRLDVDEESMRTGGRGAVIGLLDTGFDSTCPDLAGADVVARDFVASSDDEPDARAHGTGSVLLLVGQGRCRIRGVAPAATVRFGRVVEPGGGAQPAAVARGIDWLVGDGAHVVALPLGCEKEDPGIAAAIERGAEAGVVFFAACGSGRGQVLFPARHPRVVAVAPVGPGGGVGPDTRCEPRVDLIAPGGPVGSLGSGSSVACVIAAGVAALLAGTRSR